MRESGGNQTIRQRESNKREAAKPAGSRYLLVVGVHHLVGCLEHLFGAA
jgi:hypothetical protein